MTTTSKPRTEKATRPASRWRNRWVARRDFTHRDAPIFRHAGETFWGQIEWPSRDVAETDARDEKAHHPYWVEYLGAFPVDAA